MNAGIFLFRARDMIDAFIKYAPKTPELVERAVTEAIIDLGFRLHRRHDQLMMIWVRLCDHKKAATSSLQF